MEEKPKKIKKIQVRVVEVRGPSAVVEFAGGLKRAIIPLEEIEEDSVSAETLELGVPYGAPWESLVQLKATPQQLADELRRNGIWTIEDLERNPRAAIGALQTVYGADLSALLLAAHKEVNHGQR